MPQPPDALARLFNASGGFKDEARRTLAAWFTLAGCTDAIVAPVGSAFSGLASLRAGVPLKPCCA